MSYRQFTTIAKVRDAFGLKIVEGASFMALVPTVQPSVGLLDYLQETLPIVATSGSEKARSEGIIYPVLLEARVYALPPVEQVLGAIVWMLRGSANHFDSADFDTVQ